MTIQKYSYIRKYLIIFSILFLFSGCDIVDAITDVFNGEDDDVTNTVDPGYNLIGTKVIGSTGGEINLDSIIVNVPSGAFDESNEISISVGEENDGFDEYGISSLYQISGLPSTLNKPIRLSIKYHGALEGDTLIAIGEMQHSTSLDSSLFSYETDNASDSSNYLVYNLHANSSLGKLAQPGDILSDIINFIGIGGYSRALSSQGHFMVSYPMTHEPDAIMMGEHFETAYIKCKAMGFSYSARKLWPVNVLAKPLSDSFGFYSYKNSHPNGKKTVTNAELRSFINRGKFTIDLGILSNDLELRVTCGHEFLHLVQNLYEFSSPNVELEQDWLSEATSVWIEEKYANVANYVSSSHVPVFPFWGWQYSDTKWSHADIGYGLSPIIKDIANRYGESEILQIFETIKTGILPNNAVDPVDAIKSIVEKREPLETFWHGVLSSYILGDYYNSKVNFQFLDDSGFYSKTFTIDGSYTTDSYSNNYWDLSGEIVIVKPGDISSLATIPLSFSVDKLNCGILVCKYKKGTEITPIGEVYPFKDGLVIIDDVKPIFDSGYEIVVLISNGSHDKSLNYTGGNQVILTIELASDILNGKMEFFLDQAVTNRTSSRGIEEILHFNGLNGVFSNNNYKGSYWYQSLGRTFSGDVEIAFIDNPESINFHLNGQYTYESLWGFGTVTFRYTVDYNGMPYQGLEGEYVQFHVYSENGSTVQNGQFTWSETNSQWTENLLSYSCGGGAYIRVEVDKRE